MIRTRDLVLFVVIILFLTLAIGFAATSRPADTTTSKWVISEQAAVDRAGIYKEDTIDRDSVIERLRTALSREDEVTAAPPAYSDEGDGLEAGEAVSNTADERVVQWCSERRDALAFARTWPREGVMIDVVEGVRSVALVEEVVVPTTSTTGTSSAQREVAPEIRITPLAQLPLNPTIDGPTCLGSDIIGVSELGTLIFNSDAIAYYNRPSSERIGYARDGVPIYGAYSGETDECGGYTVAGEYRYSVSQDRPYVLGCYQGQPQRFIGE